MPVVIATSLFFNRYLVPRFLLIGKKIKFGIYLLYMVIVSIYLELLVMVLAFVILADYQIENLGKIAGDIYLLTIILYLIVMVEGLVLSVQVIREKERKIAKVEGELEKERENEITIRVNRQNVVIRLGDILLIESLGDYVQVETLDVTYTIKEKISALHSRLPSGFVRVHRSFIVNRIYVSSFNKEVVRLGEKKIPIGRKYKNHAEEALLAAAST
jgi:DNA-binding LytR/AlgR family response regulator